MPERNRFSDSIQMVAPSPQVRQELARRLRLARSTLGGAFAPRLRASDPKYPGLNDGLIIPGNHFPLGTALSVVRSAASERTPLRGTIRVIVVLVDFSDKKMQRSAKAFRDLFFSTSVLPNGSVKEYYNEVSHGLIDIDGEVVGPYRMPKPLSYYAAGHSGMATTGPSARDMALEAVTAADKDVNFRPYDNDGNGFVDAFIVIHAGRGAEETNNDGDIWSHKWVLPNKEYKADSVNVYGYLTVPEDSKIGVCCHELGHLLFGWPDLYDTDNSSEGLGSWCLMAAGSWNGTGDVPGHPSAWCKAQQGWVSVTNQSKNATVKIPDVKSSYTVLRLWKNGTKGLEYFLVENRQKSRYDRQLPGGGLLVYHVDDSVDTWNDNERHYRVGLVQADALAQLEQAINRGDAGDPYPGTSSNRRLSPTSDPNSDSYARATTSVSITNISASGPTMSAKIAVRSAGHPSPARRGAPRRRAKSASKTRSAGPRRTHTAKARTRR